MKAVNTVRNLMLCHDSDSRLTTPESKARVAALYLPLLVIVMDMLPQLHNCNLEAKSNYTILFTLFAFVNLFVKSQYIFLLIFVSRKKFLSQYIVVNQEYFPIGNNVYSKICYKRRFFITIASVLSIHFVKKQNKTKLYSSLLQLVILFIYNCEM